MDLYHRVLEKISELTDGNQSKAVDFKDLVKKMGFHAHYSNIFERLSQEGWIVETAKADFVSLSHWGLKEVKKSAADSGAKVDPELQREVAKSVAVAKELAAALEKLSAGLSKDDFPAVEQKLGELQNLLAQVKNKLS